MESHAPVILLTDDSRLVVVMLRRILEQAGGDVIVASNGPDAYEIGRTQHIDAAVLDQVMPGMLGSEVVHAWRAEGIDVPAAIFSSIGDERTIHDIEKVGIQAYLQKPLKAHELVATLNQMLGRDLLEVPES